MLTTFVGPSLGSFEPEILQSEGALFVYKAVVSLPS